MNINQYYGAPPWNHRPTTRLQKSLKCRVFTLNINVYTISVIKGTVNELNLSTDHHSQLLSQTYAQITTENCSAQYDRMYCECGVCVCVSGRGSQDG